MSTDKLRKNSQKRAQNYIIDGFEDTDSSVSQEYKSNEKEEKVIITKDIALAKIEVRSNIRTEFEEESIDDLAQSLEEEGQLQAITVYLNEDTMKYVVLAGERRYRAAKKLNWKTIRCTIVSEPETEERRVIIQLVENLQRENLSPEEVEQGVAKLMESGLSLEDVALKLHKSVKYIKEVMKGKSVRDAYSDKISQLPQAPTSSALSSLAQEEEGLVNTVLETLIDEGKKGTESEINTLKKQLKNKTPQAKKSIKDDTSSNDEAIISPNINDEETSDIDWNDTQDYLESKEEEIVPAYTNEENDPAVDSQEDVVFQTLSLSCGGLLYNEEHIALSEEQFQTLVSVLQETLRSIGVK